MYDIDSREVDIVLREISESGLSAVCEPGDATRYQIAVFPIQSPDSGPMYFAAMGTFQSGVMVVDMMHQPMKATILPVEKVYFNDVELELDLSNPHTVYWFTWMIGKAAGLRTECDDYPLVNEWLNAITPEVENETT